MDASAVVVELKAWRERNDLSQEAAAQVIADGGVPLTYRTLRGWEIGDRRPGPMAAKLLEGFLKSHPKVKTQDKRRYRKKAKAVSALDVKRVKELRVGGATLREIGREVGITESAVSRICGGSRHGGETES